MGCHTWFYKKMEHQPSYDDVKTNVLHSYNEDIKLYQQFIDGTLDDDTKDLFREFTKETAKKYLLILERSKRMVEKDLCKVAVCNRYGNCSMSLIRFHNGYFYIDSDNLPHDIFRIHNYPNDILLSLQETLDYLEVNDDKIEYYGYDEVDKDIIKLNAIERLKEYWEKYPDGMIDFG